MTHVAHDELKETPRKPTDDKKTPIPRPPADLDRTGLALRWAAILIGLVAAVAVVVLAIAAVNDSEPEIAADSIYIFDAQLAARAPEGFVPTGWEAETVTLIPFDPATRSAMVPDGYVPTGWLQPDVTIVFSGSNALRPVLPEGFVPINRE